MRIVIILDDEVIKDNEFLIDFLLHDSCTRIYRSPCKITYFNALLILITIITSLFKAINASKFLPVQNCVTTKSPTPFGSHPISTQTKDFCSRKCSFLYKLQVESIRRLVHRSSDVRRT